MKNENVLYIERSVLERNFDLTKECLDVSENSLNQLRYGFVPRIIAETDASKKQLIPYVLMMDDDGKVLIYQRNGSEKRLSQKYSTGIGGHVNDGDVAEGLLQTLLKGACREIKEEIGIDIQENQLKMVGLINEEKTDVGHSHTGVVFTLKVDKLALSFDTEIANPQWVDPSEVPFDRAELWTAMAIKLLRKEP